MHTKEDLLDKKLYQLGHELQTLRRRLFVTVPLPQPVRVGWRRFHVLSSKADGRADKAELRSILELIGTTFFSRIRDFRVKKGRKRRRRLVELEQPLREIPFWDWMRRGLPEAWLPYFRIESRLHYRTWIEVAVFAQPSLFELKVAPRYVTELQHVDPDVEKRISEIRTWIENRHLMGRLERVCGWRHWKTEPNHRKQYERLAKDELRMARENLWEAEVTHSKRVGHVSLITARSQAYSIFSPA